MLLAANISARYTGQRQEAIHSNTRTGPPHLPAPIRTLPLYTSPARKSRVSAGAVTGATRATLAYATCESTTGPTTLHNQRCAVGSREPTAVATSPHVRIRAQVVGGRRHSAGPARRAPPARRAHGNRGSADTLRESPRPRGRPAARHARPSSCACPTCLVGGDLASLHGAFSYHF